MPTYQPGHPVNTHTAHFSRSLLNPDVVIQGLRSHDNGHCNSRFAIHRSPVCVSPVDALAETFDVVQSLVGEEFFRAMALVFVRTHPPKSAVLANYGDAFADFIARFEPAASLAYLPDVARLAFARVQSHRAADVIALSAEALSGPLTDPDATLTLHPSVHVIHSKHAIVSLWAAHQGSVAFEAIKRHPSQAALVFRREFDVHTQAVPAASAAFIAELQSGESLLSAIDTAQSVSGDFALTKTLATLVNNQLITQVDRAASTS
ncbi:MAG: DUF2063 domain-containing protein [Betaproteobacteria bacterium]|nr:MAG: DUF2063 domain-containing protein [Betaproteobacteria bacterium]